MSIAGLQVYRAEWDKYSQELLAIRHRVFHLEQGIAKNLDVDGADPACWHILASVNTHKHIACVRLSRQGKLGRLAVLKGYRQLGVARLLMQEAERLALEHAVAKLYLHAQEQVIAFYSHLGYEREGLDFIEAGLPHCLMLKKI